MNPQIVISVLSLYVESHPRFARPLATPNPRIVGGGPTDKNLIFRTVLTNVGKTPYVAAGASIVASFGNQPPTAWVKDLNIPADDSVVLQGMNPGIMDGLCTLPAVGIPDGPVELNVGLQVGGKDEARVIAPLILDGYDLYAGGLERPILDDLIPGEGTVDLPKAAAAALVTATKRLAVVVTAKGKLVTEELELGASIAKLNVFLK